MRFAMPSRLPCVVTAGVLLIGTAGPARGAGAEAPVVTVGSVAVEPREPGPETLCRLEVQLVHRGQRPVTALAFRVRVNGAELDVYRNLVYMERLAPGEARTLRLYNFWSTERGRPAPTDGVLSVEVSLVEARFADGEREAVAGLPAASSVRLPFRAAGRP